MKKILDIKKNYYKQIRMDKKQSYSIENIYNRLHNYRLIRLKFK